MKNINLPLLLALLINIPAAATMPLEEAITAVNKKKNSVSTLSQGSIVTSDVSANLSQGLIVNSEDIDASANIDCRPVRLARISCPVASVYCPELNCWSLKECFQHNKRLIFLESMRLRQQSKRQKVAREATPVLPMLPEVLQHLVGSYAQEKPTQYRIKGYKEFDPTTYPDSYNIANIFIDSAGSHLTVKPTEGGPSFLLALNPIELDFFNETNKYCAKSVEWQHTEQEGMTLFMSQKNLGKSDSDKLDKFFLKLSSPENKALKAANLLPKKRKK